MATRKTKAEKNNDKVIEAKSEHISSSSDNGSSIGGTAAMESAAKLAGEVAKLPLPALTLLPGTKPVSEILVVVDITKKAELDTLRFNLKEDVDAIEVSDSDSYTKLSTIITSRINRLIKDSDSVFKPTKQSLDRMKEAVRAEEKKYGDFAEDLKKVANKKLNDYDTRLEEQARRERERIAEEQRQEQARQDQERLRLEAQADRLAKEIQAASELPTLAEVEAEVDAAFAAADRDGVILSEERMTELQDKLDSARNRVATTPPAMAPVPITHPAPILPPAIRFNPPTAAIAPPSVAGMSASRDVARWTLEDFEKVILHVAADIAKPIHERTGEVALLSLNQVAMNARVKASGEHTNIPGIGIYMEKVRSSRVTE